MGEFDELVSRHGVLVAGRLGPDWRVAEHKSTGLFVEIPQVFEMVTSFCASIQMTLNTMALAMTRVSPVPETWSPGQGLGRFHRRLLVRPTRRSIRDRSD